MRGRVGMLLGLSLLLLMGCGSAPLQERLEQPYEVKAADVEGDVTVEDVATFLGIQADVTIIFNSSVGDAKSSVVDRNYSQINILGLITLLGEGYVGSANEEDNSFTISRADSSDEPPTEEPEPSPVAEPPAEEPVEPRVEPEPELEKPLTNTDRLDRLDKQADRMEGLLEQLLERSEGGGRK